MSLIDLFIDLLPTPVRDGRGSYDVSYSAPDFPSDHNGLLIAVGYLNASGLTVTKYTSFNFESGAVLSFTPPHFGIAAETPGFVQLVRYLSPNHYDQISEPLAITLEPVSTAPGTGGGFDGGSIAISTASPAPFSAGVTETVTGPDVGICSTAVVGYYVSGSDGATHSITLSAALTRVDQNTATFVCPDLGVSELVTGFVRLIYIIDGVTTHTVNFAVGIQPIPTTEPPAPSVPPHYGYDVPDEDMFYPLSRVAWTFDDPYDENPDTNHYDFPINPNKMTSPFPQRTINVAHTTAVTGQHLLTEGSPKPAQWSFSGTIFRGAHYDALRSWVYERNRRIIVTDHFGRQITCVLLNFDAQPTKQDKRKYWLHTYTITAIVLDVGAPTEVPA